MDVTQVILPMCSDRVGSAVVIFDVFSKLRLWCHISNKRNDFSYGQTSDLQEYKIWKMRNLRAQPYVNHSTLANSKFKLLPRSNGNISLFSFFLSPSSSLFFCLCLHHPYEPETGMFQKWTLMIQCWCWTYRLLRHVGQRSFIAHTHMYRYKTIIIHHHMLELSQNTQHKYWRLNFIALPLVEWQPIPLIG